MRCPRGERGGVDAQGPRPRCEPGQALDLGGVRRGGGHARAGRRVQLAAFITEPKHDETIDRLRWIADNPGRADLAKTFDLLAMPFLFGTALVYVLLSRERSRRLAYAGGILLGCGMVGLTAVQGYEILQFKLAQDSRFDLIALADTVDEVSPPMIAMLLLFIPGAIFGLLTFTVALWRSRAVPRGAVLLIPAFIVVDISCRRASPATPSRSPPHAGWPRRCCSQHERLRRASNPRETPRLRQPRNSQEWARKSLARRFGA